MRPGSMTSFTIMSQKRAYSEYLITVVAKNSKSKNDRYVRAGAVTSFTTMAQGTKTDTLTTTVAKNSTSKNDRCIRTGSLTSFTVMAQKTDEFKHGPPGNSNLVVQWDRAVFMPHTHTGPIAPVRTMPEPAASNRIPRGTSRIPYKPLLRVKQQSPSRDQCQQTPSAGGIPHP